jgi:hypothetical protein
MICTNALMRIECCSLYGLLAFIRSYFSSLTEHDAIRYPVMLHLRDNFYGIDLRDDVPNFGLLRISYLPSFKAHDGSTNPHISP